MMETVLGNNPVVRLSAVAAELQLLVVLWVGRQRLEWWQFVLQRIKMKVVGL